MNPMNKIFRDLMLALNKFINGVAYKNNNCFVFGEWFGRKSIDNCLYLANYIQDKYPEYEIIWVSDKNSDLRLLDHRIKRIVRNTPESDRIVKNASVLIMNQGLGDFSTNDSFNVSGPLKVNLWHGIAWKKIGYDGVPNSGFIRNLEHKFQIWIRRSDLYVSPSTEVRYVLKSAFLIRDKCFVNTGLPRNLIFYSNDLMTYCKERLLSLINRRKAIIISYLPTFRDYHVKPFAFSDIQDKDFWDWIEQNDLFIVQKAHFADNGKLKSNNQRIINVDDISAQELMAASDMLITDYSSCFFDYLLLDRPIIHYLYDYEYYKNKDRGLYYNKKDVVCGAAPETIPELIKAIKENIENPNLYHDLRMERKQKFMTYESTDSCEIIVQRIFEEMERRKK